MSQSSGGGVRKRFREREKRTNSGKFFFQIFIQLSFLIGRQVQHEVYIHGEILLHFLDAPGSRSRSGIRILCGLLYRKAQDTEEKESGSQNELVRQAVAYIQQNYRNPLTLKETAEYVGLSPSYF